MPDTKRSIRKLKIKGKIMSENTKEYVRFQRANYIVSDLKKSLKLYCDVLGFINQYESDAPEHQTRIDL